MKRKKKIRMWLLLAAGGLIAAFSFGYFMLSSGGQMVPIIAWYNQMKKDCSNLDSTSDSDIAVGTNYDHDLQSMAHAVGIAMHKAYGYNPAFVYAMIGHETGFGKDYTNGLKNLNLAGIQYNAAYMSDYATSGEIVGDGAGKGTSTYAKFKSLDDFAKVWYKVYLKPDFEGKNPKTVEEWATLLKKHKYFEGDLNTYISAMNSFVDQYNKKYGNSSSDDDDEDLAIADSASSDYDSVDFKTDGATADQCKALGFDVGGDDDDASYGNWTWPIGGIAKGKTPAYVDGGQYGVTSYGRGKTNFHDGFDFSSGANGFREGSNVYAVTDATVYKVGYADFADEYIWLRTSDGYNIIYQEGFNSNDIKVKKGDKVKAGQKIAILGSGKSHVHLGITTDSRNPGLKSSGNPVYFGYDHPKAWMNPITVISNGMKKGSSLGNVTLTGNAATNAKLLAGILKKIDKKATDNGIAAILGNWYHESSLNPTSVNTSSGASGLGQWLGGRLTNLKKYASGKHKKWTDPIVQLQFAYYAEGSDSQKFRKALRSHDSYQSTARWFSQNWERGGDDDKHVNGAKIVAKALGID